MKHTGIAMTYGFAGIFLLSSCLKDLKDIDQVETISYEPSFSIPIGPLSYTLEEIMPPDSLIDYLIPDTIPVPDTTILIYNDNQYFYNPKGGYDASYLEPFDLSSISRQSEFVQSVMLKTNITNSLPVGIVLDGYLLDSRGDVISPLSQDSVRIDGPELDNRGAVIEPVKYTLYTHFKGEEASRLNGVIHLELYLHLQTYNEGIDTLRVYSENGIGLQFGLRADLAVPLTP